ncbi:MAG: arylsulfatase [Gammaproteobacteria bacterium]
MIARLDRGISIMFNERRSYLTLILAGISLGGCDRPAAPTEGLTTERRQPNILLIMTDDMGYTDLGSFGSEIRTPNLDALAFDGVRLTNFHAGPACESTRAMLMSGTYNRVAGVVDDSRNPGFLNDRIATLPELLQDAGYHTYMAGKWHIGRTEEQSPAGHGFESSFALMRGSAGHFDSLGPGEGIPIAAYTENGQPVDLPADFYSTEFYADRILEYLRANEGDDRPFFAWYTPTAPHWPLQVPDAYLNLYDGTYDAGYDDLLRNRLQRANELGVLPDEVSLTDYPRTGVAWADLSDEERSLESRRMEIYAAMMENFDDQVGRLLDYLRDADRLEDTYVVFISDNGGDVARRSQIPWVREYMDNSLENIGRRGSYVALGAWGDATTAPYRGSKQTPFEGGIRVPAFVSHAAVANPGSTNDEFLTIMDVMPTFLDLAGTAHPGSMYRGRELASLHGRSFLGLLSGDDSPIHPADEAIGWSSGALFKGDWKLVRGNESEPWALYDIARDPSETTDLASTTPEILAELLSDWGRFEQETGIQ